MRPVPRWLRIWAIASVLLAVLLLAFGGFVTSFRAGMADPVWPTEPWYLANNYKADLGYLIEHTHRILGFLVGAAVSVLAIAVWWGEPDKRLKWAGFAAILLLLAAYGEFHRGMGEAQAEFKTLAAKQLSVDSKSRDFEQKVDEAHIIDRITWPKASAAATGVFALAVIACGIVAGLNGSWLRAWAMIALVAIMIQGLLGGFRVFFNALAGTNLAAIHGGFGQLAFCTLIAVMVLATPRRAGDCLPESEREPLLNLSGLLAFLLGLQLLFAVMLRHGGSGIAQRLHLLMAFGVTGVIIWLVARINAHPESKHLLRGASRHLVFMLALQLALGVESYIGKFSATGEQGSKAPEQREINAKQAFTRTAHQLIGCGLLASAVALVIRAGRRPTMVSYHQALQEKEVPPVAAMAFNMPAEAPATGKVPDVASLALKPPEGGIVR